MTASAARTKIVPVSAIAVLKLLTKSGSTLIPGCFTTMANGIALARRKPQAGTRIMPSRRHCAAKTGETFARMLPLLPSSKR